MNYIYIIIPYFTLKNSTKSGLIRKCQWTPIETLNIKTQLTQVIDSKITNARMKILLNLSDHDWPTTNNIFCEKDEHIKMRDLDARSG